MLSIYRRVADTSNLQREREVMFSLNKLGDVRFDVNDTSGGWPITTRASVSPASSWRRTRQIRGSCAI
jgi:hypothetical protein